eukprot:jgi/Psemu1/301255/fgenesh1_kg.28_\
MISEQRTRAHTAREVKQSNAMQCTQSNVIKPQRPNSVCEPHLEARATLKGPFTKQQILRRV